MCLFYCLRCKQWFHYFFNATIAVLITFSKYVSQRVAVEFWNFGEIPREVNEIVVLSTNHFISYTKLDRFYSESMSE